MSVWYDKLERWQVLKASIAKLTAEERSLRQELFEGTFPNPEEGTNTAELPDGRKIKGVYKISRTVREKDLTRVPKDIRDEVFAVKHSLKTRQYRKLTDAQRAKVDEALTIKPGLPALEVVPAPEA